MKYSFSFPQPQNHIIRISIDLPAHSEATELWLPTWRPGRYEIAPYIENIVDVHAETLSGKRLKVRKTATHRWKVEASPEEDFRFRYGYYAVALDAGGSYFAEDYVYFNGVNLLMYRPGHLAEPCDLELHLPEGYAIACGLPRTGNVLHAEDFHQAVDAPLIASNSLQHGSFEVEGITHNLWFQGDAKPNWSRLEAHFQRFGAAQTKLFGDFPASEYHYLFLAHNVPYYHGVEHFNSTVIALGPSYKLMDKELYEELLGVSCHELFHTWNVKAIRPQDMQPYNYEGPNYSKLHYVTEGVTTYYGDLMLLKSGVWDLDTYLRVFNNSVLKRHYANDGAKHITLEEASFDSWLNAYKPGTPNRKISFYTKGALAAFILDYLIRASSGNARSLDTVMREMYERFGKTGQGYTRADYREIAEKHAGTSLGRYFQNVTARTVPLEAALKEAANYFGLEFGPRMFTNDYEKIYGLRFDLSKEHPAVVQVYEGSPAESAGISVGDELVALGGLKVIKADLALQFDHLGSTTALPLHLFRNGKLVECSLQADPMYQADFYMLAPLMHPSQDQIKNRASWMSISQTQLA